MLTLDLTRLGNAIRSSRIAAGLSQDAAAKVAGISQSYLSFLESGKKEATTTVLVDLARAVGSEAHVWIRAAVVEVDQVDVVGRD